MAVLTCLPTAAVNDSSKPGSEKDRPFSRIALLLLLSAAFYVASSGVRRELEL